MNQTGFYLLFIPGLTILSFLLGTTLTAFAMTQGSFRETTRRGLLSLSLVLVLLVAIYLSTRGYRPLLPHHGAPAG